MDAIAAHVRAHPDRTIDEEPTCGLLITSSHEGPRNGRNAYMRRVDTIELMALVWLAESDPSGTYLVEEVDGLRILWRMTEGEPEDAALAPATLWPMLLPDRKSRD
jgi:hypothetical protein